MDHETPLETCLGMRLQRTDQESNHPIDARKLNAMRRQTYRIITVLPSQVILKEVDAPDNGIEGAIWLYKARITPLLFDVLKTST